MIDSAALVHVPSSLEDVRSVKCMGGWADIQKFNQVSCPQDFGKRSNETPKTSKEAASLGSFGDLLGFFNKWPGFTFASSNKVLPGHLFGHGNRPGFPPSW